jgi:hypothetical protein
VWRSCAVSQSRAAATVTPPDPALTTLRLKGRLRNMPLPSVTTSARVVLNSIAASANDMFLRSKFDRQIDCLSAHFACGVNRPPGPTRSGGRSTQRLKHDSRTLSALTPKQRTYVGARAQFQRTQHTESTVPHSNALRSYRTITHTHAHMRNTADTGEAILAIPRDKYPYPPGTCLI